MTITPITSPPTAILYLSERREFGLIGLGLSTFIQKTDSDCINGLFNL